MFVWMMVSVLVSVMGTVGDGGGAVAASRCLGDGWDGGGAIGAAERVGRLPRMHSAR
jgi:hypothetical protein